MVGEEADPPRRVQRGQHARVARDVVHADRRQREEPRHDHRAERLADPVGAVALGGEQHHQHRDGQRQHRVRQRRRSDLQALDRGQHRDRRGQHAIAEEQRGAEHAEQADRVGGARSGPQRALRQRGQCHDPAFAIVVRAQHHQHVLHRDHQHQRPEHQRQHAEHVGRRRRESVVRRERFLDRVQRAGADVAEHDADRAEDEGAEAGLRMRRGGVRRGGGGRHGGSGCCVGNGRGTVDPRGVTAEAHAPRGGVNSP